MTTNICQPFKNKHLHSQTPYFPVYTIKCYNSFFELTSSIPLSFEIDAMTRRPEFFGWTGQKKLDCAAGKFSNMILSSMLAKMVSGD